MIKELFIEAKNFCIFFFKRLYTLSHKVDHKSSRLDNIKSLFIL